jgi:peptidoglycan/LPS O-acetylase OafA/YrhL
MMRTLARALAGFNALYQGVVGLLCIASPVVAAGAFKVPGDVASTRGMVRIVGGLLFGNAVFLAIFARDPEKNPSLAAALSAGAIANVTADVLICSSGDMAWSQLGVGIGAQVAMLIPLLAFALRK